MSYKPVLSEKIRNERSYRADIQRIVREADDMLSGNYVFNNFWDMEPCDTPINNSKIAWDTKYNDDEEWSYMFTRFDYSYKLIIAYEITCNKEYIDHGFKIIKKWTQDNGKFLSLYFAKIFNRIDHGRSLAHRTLDLAIFAYNISNFTAYCYDNNIIDNVRLEQIKNIVSKIASLIKRSDRIFKTETNWGPIENGCILCALKILDCNFPHLLFENRLVNQLKKQIYPDGSHIESSPMYLVEVLLPIMKYLVISKDSSAFLYETANRICEYLQEIALPDLSIPNIGDSDRINISDLMLISRELFCEEKFLNRVNRKISIEYIYKFREISFNKEAVPAEYWKSTSITLLSYQAVIKDSTKRLYMLCNNIPHGPSGHKHCDYLSFILNIHNKDILIDCGRETYKNDSIRLECKSAKSHNTFVVNEDEYWKPINAWKDIDQYFNHSVVMLSSKNGTSIVMSCSIKDSKMVLYRIISYFPNFGIVVSDYACGDTFRKYDAFFNIAPNTYVEQKENNVIIMAKDIQLFYHNSINNLEIIQSQCSFRYNTSCKNCRIHNSSSKRFISHYFLFERPDLEVKLQKGDLIYLYNKKEILMHLSGIFPADEN